MALTIETGAVVAGANSFVTVAEIKAFVGSVALPTATDSEIERAAVNAGRYLDGYYRARWKGARVQPLAQCMEWPRYGVEVGTVAPYIGGVYLNGAVFNQYLPTTTIPQRVKDAQCELALRSLTGALSADSTTGIKREKLDVIETEYVTGSAPIATYAVVDQLLSDYLSPLGCSTLQRG